MGGPGNSMYRNGRGVTPSPVHREKVSGGLQMPEHAQQHSAVKFLAYRATEGPFGELFICRTLLSGWPALHKLCLRH